LPGIGDPTLVTGPTPPYVWVSKGAEGLDPVGKGAALGAVEISAVIRGALLSKKLGDAGCTLPAATLAPIPGNAVGCLGSWLVNAPIAVPCGPVWVTGATTGDKGEPMPSTCTAGGVLPSNGLVLPSPITAPLTSVTAAFCTTFAASCWLMPSALATGVTRPVTKFVILANSPSFFLGSVSPPYSL